MSNVFQPDAHLHLPGAEPPYPNGQVMHPFQPPVEYVDGKFRSNKSLLSLLESGEYTTEMAAASIVSDVAQHPPADINVTLYNSIYQPIGTLNDYLDLKVEFARNKVATAAMTLKGNEPLIDTLLDVWNTTLPITIEYGAMRWSGRVFTVSDKFESRVNTVDLQCISDYAWLDKILCWPAPELPIQIQFPSRALYIGPAVTCIKTMVAEQALRLQSGIWEAVNNVGSFNADWKAIFGRILQISKPEDLLTMLMVPIVVVPTDPIHDTSPFVSFSGRMDKLSELIKQVVKDNGLHVTCQLWLPGDPQPEGMIVPLDWPCIVVDVKDRQGVTGPSGTFFDGILRDVVDLQRSILGETLQPFLNPSNEYRPIGINIAPTLGVDFVEPWTIFTDFPENGLINFKVVAQHPLAYTVLGGGKSPQWVDDLINETLEWIVDSVQIIIGISGVPTNFLDGIFDDVLIAFQQIENGERRIKLGPFGFPEYFTKTGGSAFTLDEWFALRGAMWESRGYPTYQWSFLNGWPYTLGIDVFPGQLVSFVRRGKMYTDFVESATLTDNRKTRARVDLVVGDGKLVENPVTKVQRKIADFEAVIKILSLSATG